MSQLAANNSSVVYFSRQRKMLQAKRND